MTNETEIARPGPLILAGGAEFNDRMAAADRAWLALLGRSRPRLGVIPTAAERRPDLAAANGVRHFTGLEAQAEATMITDTRSAAADAIVRAIEQLDAAYIAGGSPLHLVSTLVGSPAWRALAEGWRRGMALGGSSAGAMALCGSIYLREQWADGLGLVAGAVVLPHFDNRDAAAAERARVAVSERGIVGLGIDESTALIWHDDVWSVAGPGRVVVLAADGARTYRDGETISGLPAPA